MTKEKLVEILEGLLNADAVCICELKQSLIGNVSILNLIAVT